MALMGLFAKKDGQGFATGAGGGPSDPARIDRTDVAGRLALLDCVEDMGLGWFWATDALGRLTYLSESAASQFGDIDGGILGSSLSSLFSTDTDIDGEEKARPLGFLISTRNAINELPVRVVNEQRVIWWSISGRPQLDTAGDFLGYRGSATDITAERERQRDAARLSQFDSLTGLANRHRMHKRLSNTLDAYRAARRSCALIMLDLDRFKQVNDTLGHPAGDELLKQVSRRLQTVLGKRGEIGRLGGDEFQIVLPDVDDRGQLGELAARLIQMVSQPYSIDGVRATIGTSVGVAIAPYDGIDAEELVSSADLALYAAKGGGRGQYRFYSSELKDGARLRRQLEEDLRDALHRDELTIAFQPIVRADTDQVTAFEALMRWRHPERGAISPDMFIPIAEETEIIGELGAWALRKSCELAAQWPGKVRIAVNVSPVQFGGDDLVNNVAAALNASGLEPNRLELEITESVLLGDEEGVHDTFMKLKQIGVRLVLDDFGTGYSSLGYLRKAPFDKIKIDRSFVRGATEDDNNNTAIITAIVSLAQALGMETVAEGVEALDELALVRAHGVSHVQGYVYGEATGQAELIERLINGKLQYEPMGPAKHRADRRTMFRRIGVIHEDHRYEAVMRNLSKTGARIEGLLEVPIGTTLVLDLGEGQLAVAKVRRSRDHSQGVEFETPLISDGSDGLCTRHRISPYALAAAGMPLAALPPGHYPLFDSDNGPKTLPRFIQVDLSHPSLRAA